MGALCYLFFNMAGCNGRDTGTGANSEPPMRRPNCPAGPCRAHLAAPALLLAAALFLGSQAAVYADKSSLASSDLTASNWTLLLQGEWMVKFFAPWCSACQQIQAEWEKFAESSLALDVTVGKVDVTQEPVPRMVYFANIVDHGHQKNFKVTLC